MTLTPVQRKMLALLADGLPHRPEELRACLADDMGDVDNVRPHVSRLRKHLRPKGQDVLLEVAKGRYHYRLVRLIASSNDN